MPMVETPSFALDTYIAGREDAQKLALVLPGLVDTKDRPYLQEHANYLAGLDYLVVVPDPPGTWGSSGSIEDYTVTNYLKMANELIDHFGKRPTLAVGPSFGGRMALSTPIQNEHVNGTIAITTVFPFIRDENRESRKEKWKKEEERRFTIDDPNAPGQYKEFWLPYSHSEDAQQYDEPGMQALGELAIPKLFVIATRDKVVPPAAAYETYEVAAEPKELRWIYSGHDYWRDPKQVRAVNRMMGGFLRRAGLVSPE